MIPAHTIVVGNERMAKCAPVQRRGKTWASIDRFLVPLAKRKEEFVAVREAVVYTHCPSRVENRIDRRECKVVDQLVLVCRGRFRDELENVARNGANGNLVACKGLATLHSINCLRRRRIE